MSAQVAQTLIVEMDARTVSLEAKLAEMERKLKSFESKATQAGDAPARVVGSIGDRYATAARQIAYAGEQAARTGKLAGEAGRQMVSQGANMALMFGPAGAIGGAVAITTMAIVEMFVRARREMAETANKFRSELEEMARSGDVARISFERQQRFSGDPFAIRKTDETAASYLARRRGLQGVTAQLDAVPGELAAINRGERDKAGLSATQQSNHTRLLREQLEAQRIELVKHKKTLERELAEIDPILAAAIGKSVEETTQGIKRDSEKSFRKTKEEMEREAEQLRGQVKDLTASVTGSAADVAARALEKQTVALKEAIDKNDALDAAEKRRLKTTVASAAAARAQTIEVQRAVEQLDVMIKGVDAAGAAGGVFSFLKLNDAQRELLALKEKFKGNAAAEKEINAALLKIDQLRAKLVKEMAGDAPKSESVSKVRDMARAIGTAVQGAAELATAFGLVDANVGRVLASVGQLATNIPGALDFFKEKNKELGTGATKANATALLGAAGAAATIASVAISLFGESPAEKERKRVLEENSRALRDLTDTVGLLGAVGLSGSATMSGQAALSALFAKTGIGASLNNPNQRQPFFTAAWKDLTDAQRDQIAKLAKELNITLDGTVESFEILQKAIAEASGKLAEFGEDFGGRQGWLDFQRTIFGDKGTLDNLGKLLGAFAGDSGGIASILAAGDPTTAEGRAAMRRMIEEFALLMAAGGGTISNETLGNLSGDEFRRLLEQITGYLDEVDGRGSGSGGYNVSRQITEVTGDRLAGLLTAANAYHQRIAVAIETLAFGVSTIQAPRLPGGAGRGAGAITITIGDIILQVPPTTQNTVTRDDLQDWGAEIVDRIVHAIRDPSSEVTEAIDTSLAARNRQLRRGRGDRVVDS